MAQIIEQNIKITISKAIKNNENEELNALSLEVCNQLEEVIAELINAKECGLVVEIGEIDE